MDVNLQSVDEVATNPTADFVFEHVITNDDLSVWYYFLKDKKGGHGQCMDCQKILTCNKGSTSGFINHLKTFHDIDLKTLKEKRGVAQVKG